MISKKVVLAAGGRSPSSSPSTSLPPSPSSWQKEDWEPDFLEAALISLEVKAGGGGGGGSGGIASKVAPVINDNKIPKPLVVTGALHAIQ